MDEVAEIKNRLEITEVVANYLPLKQSGRNLKAACPFHQEKSASFMVSPERGIYHCFGCNDGGDIFSFVMKRDSLSFPEALKVLAGKAGVEIDRRVLADLAVHEPRGFSEIATIEASALRSVPTVMSVETPASRASRTRSSRPPGSTGSAS